MVGESAAVFARRRRPVWVLAAAALLAASPVGSYETDQYTGRLQPIADSRELLNGVVNEVLGEVAAGWRRGENRHAFARDVYWRIGGLHWVDKIERWALLNAQVEKLEQAETVYQALPPWATRVNFVFGIGGTLRLAGSLVGTDKLGHFVSQGYKYYRRFLRSGAEEVVLELGSFAETAIFGKVTTGVFSNADLVANYEGFRFYRSLFEDGVTPGKSAIVRFEGERASIARPFDWADHVNDYWDEALSPNWFDALLQPHMTRRLRTYCDEYRRQPSAFVPRDEEALARRYARLHLRPALHNRLDRVCEAAEGSE